MDSNKSEAFLGFLIIFGGIYVVIQSVILYPDILAIVIWDSIAFAVIIVAVMAVGRYSDKVIIFSSTHLTDEQPEKKPFEAKLRSKIEEQIEGGGARIKITETKVA